ncbi:site-specific integrase [Sphingobium ummariense]|uniref:site-specific integrase n=1 Tax=Sphingobium ummariense TaxID=420994 RepID=UPI0009FEDC1E|nr:site-specific integrase [Sphingobium ummariense]
MDNSGASIVIQERRTADGLDSYIPVILRDGAIYDLHLERYFLDLPLNGSRSRHSLRAHGYDVLVWVRFLASARGKSVWQADADDVGAYQRGDEVGFQPGLSAPSGVKTMRSMALSPSNSATRAMTSATSV